MSCMMCGRYIMAGIVRKTRMRVIFPQSAVLCVSKRSLYSIDGKWEKHVTPSVLKDMEYYWRFVASKPLYIENYGERSSSKCGKKYILSMFPYPSGNLHMGHVRVYTIADVLARFHNMKGYDVIHPMGWDAFGLPAENAAIERGINPSEWTMSNIENMRMQLKNLGCCFDWSREFSTCDPNYYKWTQFIFLKLFNAGMVYRQEALVNWDPVDETVLANEQVGEDGCSWRSGAKVEKKLLKQWFIRTTKFSEALYEGLSDPSLDNWRDIPLLQKHWIGECDGYMIRTKLHQSDGSLLESNDELNLWISNPEDLNKIAFIAVKPGHVLDREFLYAESKNGYRLLKIKATNPLTGKSIPVLVTENLTFLDDVNAYIGLVEGCKDDADVISLFNFECDISTKNLNEIIKFLKEHDMGGYKCSRKLKDWLISRQRYWGTPIPIVYCDSCGTVPVAEINLPVKLPHTNVSDGRGKNILKTSQSYLNCRCPKCGRKAERETDTMDTFVDSSWYYLRYLDPFNESSMISPQADENMPVDIYVGGKEHATLHLYYARFIQKFLQSEGITSHAEPFKRLLTQGEVTAVTYQVKSTGKYLTKEEVDFSVTPPVEEESGQSLLVYNDKMSKSKFNGVDPQSILDEYGIDATRLAIISEYGPQSSRVWSDECLSRAIQILDKFGSLINSYLYIKDLGVSNCEELTPDEITALEDELFENRNSYLIGATYDFIDTFQFHSTIKCVQQLSNSLRLRKEHLAIAFSPEYEKSLICLTKILHPFCPHFTSEVWEVLVSHVEKASINKRIPLRDQPWPEHDETYRRDLKCKVNGKSACVIKVNKEDYITLTKDDAKQLALKHPDVIKMIAGLDILCLSYSHVPQGKSRINFDTLTTKQLKALKKAKRKDEK